MKKYEINKETFAVVGKEDEKTKIIEKNEEYLIDSGAYQIMDESCCYYGSSYYGRLKAAKKMLNCSYKIPILVEESSCLIFFPIKSSLLKDCCWINLNSIKKIEKYKDKSLIVFINDRKMAVPVSKMVLKNQIARATMLEAIILKRMNAKKVA